MTQFRHKKAERTRFYSYN